jgi:glutamate dehydrogenase (NAD(P)+)
MTSAQHMLWMLDEFEVLTGQRSPGFITGKPVGMGGSPGRTEATGYGVVFALREALAHLGLDVRKATASIQGFGNVARYAAERFTQMGGSVVAVSCWDRQDQRAHTYRRQGGVDVAGLVAITDAFGSIDRQKAAAAGYEVLPGAAWLEQSVDVLIPAAREGQITAANAGSVDWRVKVVMEAANGPTTPDADVVLQRAGILVVPDVLANAGGVTCSYFEQVQGNSNYYWSREDVLARLDARMTDAFQSVVRVARREDVSMRDAAYLIAVERVTEACRQRGWI